MDILKDYTYYLRMECAMSRNTVASYSSDVQRFLANYGGALENLSPADIEEYISSRADVEKRSQARALSSLRSFCRWLVLEGLLKDNPCDKVDSPKLGTYLPEVLSEEEVVAVLDAVGDRTWQDLRDRAILEVLYGCGLRVSEAASLKISGIYFEDGFVRIVGKGNKERIVPLGEVAAEAVAAYLEVRPGAVDDDVLFISRLSRPMTRVAIFNIVKKYVQKAGISKNVSPHTFRHSFATHLIEHDADLRVVQEMLGHENVTTTEIYTHIDTSTWHKDILEHHPRRNVRQDEKNS